MVQEMVSVVDKLVALIERRERREKAIFTELISPMFDELLIVHKDYIAMFSDVLDRLRKPCTGTELMTFLVDRRQELEPVRMKLEALAKELRTVHEKSDVFRFARYVVYYFTEHNSLAHGTASTSLIQELENIGVFTSTTLSGKTLQRVTDTVDQCLNRLRSTWSNICVRYAELKIASTRVG
jgi:hypothetical protein